MQPPPSQYTQLASKLLRCRNEPEVRRRLEDGRMVSLVYDAASDEPDRRYGYH